MLQAEIKGKYNLAVRDDEDYLTSTVFGHLRYVAPGPFWRELFSRAKTLPIQGVEEALTTVIGEEYAITGYNALKIEFWPKCPGLGEPELAMCFTGQSRDPLVVLVEVKLWSWKSGHGEHDQLKRYLQIADSIHRLEPRVPANAKVVVVYVTPREAASEVHESLTQYGDSDDNRRRLFRIQWQDFIVAIRDSLDGESDLCQMILKNVREFLRVRRLEYFKGFTLPEDVELMRNADGLFYACKARFQGFQMPTDLQRVQVVKGAW